MGRASKLKKFCTGCGGDFDKIKRHVCKDGTRKSGIKRYNECIDCAKKRYKKYNEIRISKWNKLKRGIILQKGGCCSICGYNDLSCLACFDFHHLDIYKKKFNLSKYIIGKPFKLEYANNYKKETKKCIIVCSNCHRKIHWHIL